MVSAIFKKNVQPGCTCNMWWRVLTCKVEDLWVDTGVTGMSARHGSILGRETKHMWVWMSFQDNNEAIPCLPNQTEEMMLNAGIYLIWVLHWFSDQYTYWHCRHYLWSNRLLRCLQCFGGMDNITSLCYLCVPSPSPGGGSHHLYCMSQKHKKP